MIQKWQFFSQHCFKATIYQLSKQNTTRSHSVVLTPQYPKKILLLIIFILKMIIICNSKIIPACKEENTISDSISTAETIFAEKKQGLQARESKPISTRFNERSPTCKTNPRPSCSHRSQHRWHDLLRLSPPPPISSPPP